jgi:chromosome segregation ATPase
MLFLEPFTPSFCVRRGWPAPGTAAASAEGAEAYDWDSFPQDDGRELHVACARLAAAEERIRALTDELHATKVWGLDLDREVHLRTEWAFGLDREIEQFNRELHERTEWALRLDSEIEDLTSRLRRLEAVGQQVDGELQALQRHLGERVPMRRCITDLLRGIFLRLRLAKPE